jgi:probable poly-beta-1,6-N-acetyl-D-glucosamine export protein
MPRTGYQFVDNIRCIAMLAIVTEHTSYLGSYVYTQESSPYWAYLTSIQLVKFGTIAFFIIAGFLFAENSGRYEVFDYLKRRFDNIFKPWLIWSLTFLTLLTAGTAIRSLSEGESLRQIVSGLWWGVKTVYLHSNYWFIMNFFFCMTVLLLSKHHLRSWKFGLFLFSLTSFYCVNVYTEWISPEHTAAIFGFVFFYWLGVQLHFHYKTVETKLKSISGYWLIALTAVTLFLSVQEASYLYGLKKVDPINTLRISNIIFSVAVFAMFLKVRSFRWLNFLQPRKTTYGIFLIHYILVAAFLPVVLGELGTAAIQKFTILDMYKYQFTRFFTVYILSFAMVQLISRSSYSWIIGIKTARKPAVLEVQEPSVERSIALKTEAA